MSDTDLDNDLSDLISAWELFVNLLGIIWLIILVLDFTGHISPLWQTSFYVIWVVFIIDFLVRFFCSKSKILFLKHNILTILSLAVPAFRTLSILRSIKFIRLLTFARGLRIITILSSLNKGMKSFKLFFGKKKLSYVILLTSIVIVLGASGMYSFEKNYPGSTGFENFSNSLWWTAMIITTAGSQSWPVSPEGRILCFLLALYAFAVFGYITASIATFLIGK